MWRLLEDESGQTAVEYALVVGALALGLIASIKLLGLAFNNQFNHQHRGLERAR